MTAARSELLAFFAAREIDAATKACVGGSSVSTRAVSTELAGSLWRGRRVRTPTPLACRRRADLRDRACARPLSDVADHILRTGSVVVSTIIIFPAGNRATVKKGAVLAAPRRRLSHIATIDVRVIAPGEQRLAQCTCSAELIDGICGLLGAEGNDGILAQATVHPIAVGRRITPVDTADWLVVGKRVALTLDRRATCVLCQCGVARIGHPLPAAAFGLPFGSARFQEEAILRDGDLILVDPKAAVRGERQGKYGVVDRAHLLPLEWRARVRRAPPNPAAPTAGSTFGLLKPAYDLTRRKQRSGENARLGPLAIVSTNPHERHT